MCCIHLLYAVTSGNFPDFPKLEIVGCPVTYHRLIGAYIVNFQWRVPFSPAALSHIKLILLRIDVMQYLMDRLNDFTIPGILNVNETVNVSYLQ